MKYNFVGQGLEITDTIKGYIKKKFQRLERLFKGLKEDEIEVHISVKKERAEYRIDVDLFVGQKGEKIHVWDGDPDLYTAVDKVIDQVERVLIKDKEKVKAERREAKKEKMLFKTAPDVVPEVRERPKVEEEELIVDKPMDVEDAILELEEKGLHFLPFVDLSTGELRILYKKKAGNYGVIRTGCKAG
ncbi:MAG TPA: ribosome-associated translation inhibitor RaiA [Aquifex aeolicus]|uniref:Ribosome hibernation promoting factor n=1 Tax=Aquifex aeolicus TaxID=63363 RepID=A0A9D1CFH4_AQUAO|nr:ribosome-associated translation inhibitor RaiA [Aquificales bacterium]HIP86738.1 ribosome-associated translation inhibitor RaiA [Aquifex sp.]HIP98890.1 ribosome-associated translation inhibitor RaiA [Aquifex aeolicus]HIQ26193.1 ribosome-associated translation inhibitor RaiA [Aquifex aeolicus]